MREQIEDRLRDLKSEFNAGQTLLTDLETRQTNLRTSLLRISGAIQVLEEMLNQAPIQPAVHLNGHAPSPAPVGAVQE